MEQVIRPTGLLDPRVEVRPVTGQIDDLVEEIRVRAARDERVLVTTLTKRMAEDLTDHMKGLGLRVRYMHSDIATIQRMELIRDLRLGEFDVLVGINLLREGLDLPEVSMVAILDADKEGFLRSETSLIQTIGRAARNAEGLVVLYADTVTPSMRGGHHRDRASPEEAGRLQQGPRHRSPDHPQERAEGAGDLPFGGGGKDHRPPQADGRRAGGHHPPAGKGNEGSQQNAGIRIRRPAA